MTLLDQVLDRLQQEFSEAGKDELFDQFRTGLVLVKWLYVHQLTERPWWGRSALGVKVLPEFSARRFFHFPCPKPADFPCIPVTEARWSGFRPGSSGAPANANKAGTHATGS